jgi:hypothetical protein
MMLQLIFINIIETKNRFKKFLENLGAQNIDVSVGGNGVEAFCKKPI